MTIMRRIGKVMFWALFLALIVFVMAYVLSGPGTIK